jgi:DNA-binding beta-propeller fold protein YncE
MKLHTLIACCAVTLALFGCAQQSSVFRIAELPDSRDENWPVWPKGEQIPRFVYVGDLTGEQNFVPADGNADARGFLAWLVGLGQEIREPVVLRRPQGVAEDKDGRIWVADVSRQAVFQFDTVAGTLQVFDQIDQARRFVAPVGVVPLPDGGAIVSDAELGVLVFLTATGEPRKIVGDGLFERPTGLALDPASGRIFVADTRANTIKVIDADGTLLATIGQEGDAAGQLNSPTYIALSEDRLYVTDTLNARIQVFDTEGRFLSSFGERGLYVGNLTRPKGIAVSEDGLVYVIESYYDYLLVFDREGRLLLPIGGTGHRPGQFYLPSGVWAGEGGRVYVSDMFNGRVAILQFLGENL